ncbi:hypothetical protein AB0N07_50640 [Streptomyces sp. NPDC051172]|uniref:hypothetical protein n=1 Tax=Streptomyces sp. NPDC051172 TaxID=3155796 RepID=UPI00341DC69A
MKLPRVECGSCQRQVAAGMVAGRPSKGRIWRHDPPGMRSMYGGSLVSCAGSLVIVDLPLPAQQLEFPDAADELADVDGAEEMALF